MLPGYSGTFPPQPHSSDPAAIAATLDDAEGIAAELEQRLLTGLAERVTEQQNAATQLEMALLGSLGVLLEKWEPVAGKILNKMLRVANQHLDNGYTHAFPYGAVQPTIEQVATGLQTGDYFGTMGLNGRGPEGIPPPGPPGDNEPPCFPPGNPCPPSYGGPPLDECGRCPHGFVNNAGTGTFCEMCVPDMGWGGGGEPPPPPPPPGPPPGPQPPPASSCPKRPRGIKPSFGEGQHNQDGGHIWGEPWMFPGGGEPPGDYESATIVHAPEGEPPRTETTVWFPKGMRLYVQTDGSLWYANFEFSTFPWPPLCFKKVTPPGDQPPPPPGLCPAPPDLLCGPILDWKPNLLTWDESDVCQQIAKALKDNYEGLPAFTKLMGWATSERGTSTIADYITQAFLGRKQPILEATINGLAKWLETQTKTIAEGMKGCIGEGMPIALTQAPLRFLDQWFGIVPKPLMKIIEQTLNSACQSVLPSGSEADAAYLSNTIDQELWKCWHKAEGDHLTEADAVMKARRARPDPFQLCNLYRREKIDRKEWEGRMRGAGFIEEGDRDRFFALSEAWPSLSDVIRFMVRDVANKDAVDRGGLDEGFDKNWAGLLKKFGDGLGVSEELARYYWRAHFQLPSFTMATEMVRRLRPGVVDENLVVTLPMVRDLLAQDDWAPGWIDRMIAISYRPVTRTDATRMYELHAITDDQLLGYIEDEGFTNDDAKVLLEGAKRRRKVAEVRRSGLPTARTLINQFARGELAEEELRTIADKIAISPEQAQEMVESAKLARDVRNRGEMIKGLKRSFVTGLIDEGEATAYLSGAGVSEQAVDDLLQQWIIARANAGKVPGAELLCRWRAMNIIGPEEQAEGLIRVGWTEDDTARIMDECNQKNALAAKRAARAAAREAEAEYRRQQKLLKELQARQAASLGLGNGSTNGASA